jgi:hypothetical protein
MQITVIITQFGLEPPVIGASSICGKKRSFISIQTDNVERGPGLGQPAYPHALRRVAVFADDQGTKAGERKTDRFA